MPSTPTKIATPPKSDKPKKQGKSTTPKKATPKKQQTSDAVKGSFDFAMATAEPFKYGTELSVADLEQLLTQAADAYYNTDRPLLSDDAFDVLLDVLRDRAPKSKILKQLRAPLPPSALGATKVKLPYHLGSMDKVKPSERTLINWLAKFRGPYVISEKLDGLSSLLILKVADGDILEQKFYKHGDEGESEEIGHMLGFIRAVPTDAATRTNLIQMIKRLNTETHT